MTTNGNISSDASTFRPQALWRWWVGELRAMIPTSVVGWVVGDVAVTDVAMDKSGIALLRPDQGKQAGYAQIPSDAIATSPLLRELRAKGQDHVRLLLRDDQVLTRPVTLPAAIEENLREAIGFELDRHTPFKASQAYYDVRILKRDASRESIEVGLVAAARAVVDPLVAAIRNAGLVVASIGVISTDALGGQMPELLPVTEKPAQKWGNLLKLHLALLACVCVLGLIALLLPIWQKREQVKELLPVIDKTTAEYDATVRIQDEYTRLASEYNYIAGKKHALQPALAVVEELTRISPDTTWAQSLDLKTNGKTRELTIVGEAQSASKVIETLEQSPFFQNATQRSPTQRGSQPNTERFHVATEVKPRTMPTATPSDEQVPAATGPVTATVAVGAPDSTNGPASTGSAAGATGAKSTAVQGPGAGTATQKADATPPAVSPPAGAPATPAAQPAPTQPKQLPLTVLPQSSTPPAAPVKQP
jgi:general secretion pathway protein L